MTIIARFPLKTSVPLFLVLMGLIIGGLTIGTNLSNADRDTEELALEYVTQNMTSLQRNVAGWLRTGETEQIQKALSGWGVDPNIDLAMLIDDNGRVLNASRLEFIGRPVATLHGFDVGQLARTSGSMAGTTLLTAGRDVVCCYYPVWLGVATGELRPTRAGVLFMRYDLTHVKTAERYRVYSQSLWYFMSYAALFMALGFYLHLALTKRVSQLVDTTRRFAAGDTSVRAATSGKDELSQIGAALNAMIAKIGADQEALRKERDLVGRIAETSPIGITMVDREGRIIYANPRAEQILGLSRNEIVGQTYNAPSWRITDYQGEPFPPEQLPFARVMSSGQPVQEMRHAIEWPDGRRVLLLINGAPLLSRTGEVDGMVAAIQDVTEQVRSAQAFQERSEELDNYFSISLDLLCIADTDGNFRRLNQAWERTLGFTRAELMAKRFLDFVHPDDLQATLDAVAALASQRQVIGFVNRYRCKDGSYRWLEWRSAPVGKMIHAVARDITGRIALEEDLRRLNEELEQRVKARTAELAAKNLELERLNRMFVGRELRMVELKRKIRELEQGGQGPVIP